MRTVYKYPIEFADEFTMGLPNGAKILDCQMQNGVPCIWALVDSTEVGRESRRFRLAGTGHDIFQIPAALKHISTFQPQPGLVFHLFEIIQI